LRLARREGAHLESLNHAGCSGPFGTSLRRGQDLDHRVVVGDAARVALARPDQQVALREEHLDVAERMAATRAGANPSNVMLTVDIESGTVALPEAVIFGPACDRCPGTNER
jgi:hypothetical protein